MAFIFTSIFIVLILRKIIISCKKIKGFFTGGEKLLLSMGEMW